MDQHQQMHCTTNHHRLWKLNTGLQETWSMSFSTLPPDSRTLVSKWNTKLALIWKEDFGPLGNSPVLLLLSPGKTPLATTVSKFLDTSVCGGSWCFDPSLSPFLVKFTQILESSLLENTHKVAVLSVGCASLSSTLFPSTQLPVNMLGYMQKEPLPSIEYIYSKLTYFPEGQQLTKNVFLIGLMKYSNLLRLWIGGFLLNVSQNHHN